MQRNDILAQSNRDDGCLLCVLKFEIRTRVKRIPLNFGFWLMNINELFLCCMNYTAILCALFSFHLLFDILKYRLGVVCVFICERAYLCERANEQTGHDCRDTLVQRRDKAVSLSPIKIQHSVVRKKHSHLSLWVHSQLHCFSGPNSYIQYTHSLFSWRGGLICNKPSVNVLLNLCFTSHKRTFVIF